MLVNNAVFDPTGYSHFNSWAEQYWPPATRMFAVSGRFDGFANGGVALVDGSTRTQTCQYPYCWYNYTPWSTIPVARVGDPYNDTAPYVTWTITNNGWSGAGPFQTWADTANVWAVGGL